MGCEDHQIVLSSLLDGEAGPDETRDALDHLLGCPQCRGFYEQARALDRELTATSIPGQPHPDRRRSRPGWAWPVAAAAVLLLAVGLWPGRAVQTPPADPAARVIDATGHTEMSDTRFVELTVELLQADPRYHLEMMDVLQQAYAHEDLDEGPWTSRLARADLRRDPEGDEQRDPLVH